MKTLRSILILILAAAMLLSLASCAQAPAGPEITQTPAAPENTETPTGAEPGASGAVVTLAAPGTPEELWQELPEGLGVFTERSLPVFFADLDGENRVYSPLNVYLALGMLAELTDGDSRAQLLELLGEEDLETLRAEARLLWEVSRRDNEMITVLPAASIWLRSDFTYKTEPLDALAGSYYASAFSGPMGDPAYTQALHDWMNENTKGLLEKQVNELKLYSDTMLALVTTLYFKGSWTESFSESATTHELFRAAQGEEEADFMHRSESMTYYRGEDFGAICLPIAGSAEMWLLLPDEDSSLQALIDGGEAAQLLRAGGTWENTERRLVKLSLPKFDVDSDLQLKKILQQLGVTEVFDPGAADFSPLTGDVKLCVTRAEHAARVKIDEKGCEAAAYTFFACDEAAAIEEPEELDFVCDRPFLFAVTGSAGQVLFVGAVNSVSG